MKDVYTVSIFFLYESLFFFFEKYSERIYFRLCNFVQFWFMKDFLLFNEWFCDDNSLYQDALKHLNVFFMIHFYGSIMCCQAWQFWITVRVNFDWERKDLWNNCFKEMFPIQPFQIWPDLMVNLKYV